VLHQIPATSPRRWGIMAQIIFEKQVFKKKKAYLLFIYYLFFGISRGSSARL
jgi:hypothetical protein